MLYAGQGGTFSFGNVFRDENGERGIINGDRNLALKSKSEIKHLLFYGRNTEFIGTTGWITCVGVYFEIKGNRCFCAHINAWHRGANRTKPDATPNLMRHDNEYHEIFQAMTSRFQKHSREYGWTTDGPNGENDYVPGTLQLVSPFDVVVRHVVVRAICDFLYLDELRDSPPLYRAQGFSFEPGMYSSDRLPKGTIEDRIHKAVDPQTGNKTIRYWDLPDRIETFEYKEGNHAQFDLQPWTYQGGLSDRIGQWTCNDAEGWAIAESGETPPISASGSSASDFLVSQQSGSQEQGLIMRHMQ